MAGDSDTEKKINAFLTRQFIESRNVSDIECLFQAKDILKLPRNRIFIAKYLLDTFGTNYIGEKISFISNNISSYWIAAGKLMRYMVRSR